MRWREMLSKWNPLYHEPEPDNLSRHEYSFCETTTAGGGSPWHVRKLTQRGRFLTGAADTPALCGRQVGWDIGVPVNEFQLRGACPACVRAFKEQRGMIV